MNVDMTHAAEHVGRLMMMANGDAIDGWKWDLSDNDRLAIQHVLARMRAAEATIKRGRIDAIGEILAWLRALPKDEWYPANVADAIEEGGIGQAPP